MLFLVVALQVLTRHRSRSGGGSACGKYECDGERSDGAASHAGGRPHHRGLDAAGTLARQQQHRVRQPAHRPRGLLCCVWQGRTTRRQVIFKNACLCHWHKLCSKIAKTSRATSHAVQGARLQSETKEAVLGQLRVQCPPSFCFGSQSRNLFSTNRRLHATWQKDLQSPFKDLSFEPDIKAPSPLEAEIQRVARVVAMQPKFATGKSLPCNQIVKAKKYFQVPFHKIKYQSSCLDWKLRYSNFHLVAEVVIQQRPN